MRVISERTRAAGRKYYRLNAAATIERTTAYARTPRGKFNTQRQNAKNRGIEWNLTFEEWQAFWGDDYGRRGPKKGDLLMARNGDTGAYAVGNIKKITRTENTNEFNARRWAK